MKARTTHHDPQTTLEDLTQDHITVAEALIGQAPSAHVRLPQVFVWPLETLPCSLPLVTSQRTFEPEEELQAA